jgi:transcriptional regulator with XRE-family HTH domain
VGGDDGKRVMAEEHAQSGNLVGACTRPAMTEVSNPCLSQIERGRSEPSARVLKAIAEALNLSAEALFAQAGLMPESSPHADDATQTAIRADPRLREQQTRALLAGYRSYVAEGDHQPRDEAEND